MKEAEFLIGQARECRRQAGQAATRADRRALQQLAEYYEKEANKLVPRSLKAIH